MILKKVEHLQDVIILHSLNDRTLDRFKPNLYLNLKLQGQVTK